MPSAMTTARTPAWSGERPGWRRGLGPPTVPGVGCVKVDAGAEEVTPGRASSPMTSNAPERCSWVFSVAPRTATISRRNRCGRRAGTDRSLEPRGEGRADDRAAAYTGRRRDVMDGSFQTNAGGTQRVVFEYDTPWSQDSSGVLSVCWQKQAGPSGDPLHVVWKADRHTLPGLGRPQPGPGRATDTGWRAHRLRERGTRRAAQPELLSRQGLLGPGRRSFGCARAGLARPCCDAQSMCS